MPDSWDIIRHSSLSTGGTKLLFRLTGKQNNKRHNFSDYCISWRVVMNLRNPY